MGKSEPEVETMGISTQRWVRRKTYFWRLNLNHGPRRNKIWAFYSKATVQKAFSTSKKVLDLKETKCELFTQKWLSNKAFSTSKKVLYQKEKLIFRFFQVCDLVRDSKSLPGCKLGVKSLYPSIAAVILKKKWGLFTRPTNSFLHLKNRTYCHCVLFGKEAQF